MMNVLTTMNVLMFVNGSDNEDGFSFEMELPEEIETM